MELKAVIFDLDGVITDTAEYHYRAWQRMADEEGLPFDRETNERLRGVSRRASLEIILAGRPYSEARIAELMERKNGYYVAMLDEITPQDLLPGAVDLLRELRAAGIRTAIGSASKNARTVIDRLGIAGLMDAIADGYSVQRTKPAPDLFLKAAELLGVAPAACAVMEDAAAGVDAALAGGMWAIGLGPQERVGHADLRLDNLKNVRLEDIRRGLEKASWTIAEPAFDPDRQHHGETIFTIGNGYLNVRGAFEEGYPGDRPASFIHRLWDDVPTYFAELANIPRWWGVELWINGERFRLDRGTLLSYHRQLDLSAGLLSRTVRWRPSEGGPVLEIHFERSVSMAEQHLAVTRIRVGVVEGQADLRIRSGLNAHVDNLGLLHWDLIDQEQDPQQVRLHVRTRHTGIDLALAAVAHTGGSAQWRAGASDAGGQPAVERQATLSQGDDLWLEQYVGAATSNETDRPMQLAVDTAQHAAERGYPAVLEAGRETWKQLWERSDVVVEGDHEAQRALRFNTFQLLIAAPRFTDRASIGAKTLSGFGYRHHAFWDTEIFMLPLFTFTQPDLARNMLMYRWHNLPGARAKAQSNGYEGAQFPWESAGDGREVTPVWVPHFAEPQKLVRIWTGDIEIHITADIAYAATQYWRATGDDDWMRDYGAELVLDGARFWASAARREDDGHYHFRDVIGPDEYHDHVDDNAYTNYLVRWHLETALAVLAWLEQAHPARRGELVEALDLTETRLSHWRDVAGNLYLPASSETPGDERAPGVVEQFTGYFGLLKPDFATLRDPNRTQSMQMLLGIEGVAVTQILKQPDVLMLEYLLPDWFNQGQVDRDHAYYDPRTDHEQGSSLGPSISAIMACRVGDTKTAYQHFLRAARADLLDIRGNAGDGIHGASAGGLWQAAVFGFGGLTTGRERWQTHPGLPAHWTRLAFKFFMRGELQSVDLRSDVGGQLREVSEKKAAAVMNDDE